MPITFDTFEPDTKLTFETFEPDKEPTGFFGGLSEAKQGFLSAGIFPMTEATEAATARKRMETPGFYESIKPSFEIGPFKVYPGNLGGAYYKSTDLKQHDLKIIEDYERNQQRRFTVGGEIGRGIGQMATWAAQIILFAPVAKGITGATTMTETYATQGLTKALEKWGLASLAFGAAMPQHTIQRTAEKMSEGKSPARSFLEGYGGSVIGYFTEQTGGLLVKGTFGITKKLPFGQKLFDALEKSWVAKVPGRTSTGFWAKLYSEAGYSSMLGEIGEERLETILHAIAGTEDFGVKDDPADSQLVKIGKRLIAGLKQDFTVRNQIVEVAVLGLPTAFKAGVVHLETLANPAQRAAAAWDLQDSIETLTDEQKAVAGIYLKNIFTETEKTARARYPEIERVVEPSSFAKYIARDKTIFPNLQEIIDMVREDLGIGQQVEFVVNPKERRDINAEIAIWNKGKWTGFNKEHIKPDSKFLVTFFGPNTVNFTRIVHELRHLIEPPYRRPAKLSKEKIETLKTAGWTEEEINRTYGKRVVHPPTLAKYRETVIKQAEQLMKQVIFEGGRVPVTEAALWEPGMPVEASVEAAGAKITGEPTVTAPPAVPETQKPGETWKGPAYRAETGQTPTGTAGDVVRFEQDELGNNYGITKKQLKELDKHPAKDLVWVGRTPESVAKYGVEAGREPASQEIQNIPDEVTDVVKNGKIIATDGEGGYLVLKPSAEPKPPAATKGEGKPKLPSRKKQLADIHGLAKKLGMDDASRKELQEELTGKKSSADMTPEQRDMVINRLREMYGEPYESEEGGRFINLGPEGGVRKVAGILKEIKGIIENLPNLAEEEPSHITRRKAQATLKEGLPGQVWDLIGIDNTQLGGLGFRLNGKKWGIMSFLTGGYIRLRKRIRADIKKSILRDYIKPKLLAAGITSDDLAAISNSLNAKDYGIEIFQKYLGKDTEVTIIEINGRRFDVNWGELIEFYLSTECEGSLRHIVDSSKNLLRPEVDWISDEFREKIESDKNTKGGGKAFLFHDTNGGIPVEKIIELRQLVQNNPKAMVFVNLWKALDIDIFKNYMNQTSQTLDHKDIATTPNWYPETIVTPKGGKLTISGAETRIDIETWRALHPQTAATYALVNGDFFDTLVKTTNNVAEYTAMAEPARLLRTIFNNRELGVAWDKKGYGKIKTNAITILRNSQILTPKQGAFDKIYNKFLANYFTAVLTNARVWLSQFSSVMGYGAYIDLKYFKVIPDVFLNWKEYSKEALENDSVLYCRLYLSESTPEVGAIAAKDAVFSAIQQKWNLRGHSKLGIPMKIMDFLAMLTGRRIAIAEYLDAQKNIIKGESAEWWMDKDTSWKEGSNEWNRLVCQRSDYLWRTQSQWDKWDKSLNLSRPHFLVRSLFMFRSAHEALLNTAQEAYWEFSASAKTSADVARVSRKIGSVMASYFIDTIFRNLIILMIMGKPKKPYEYITDLITNPLDMIAIAGKVLSQGIYNFIRILEKEAPQYRGRALESPPLTIWQTLLQVPDNFAQAVAFYLTNRPDQGYTALKNAISKTFEAGSILYFGFPVYEAKRIAKSAWVERIVGEEESTGGQRQEPRRRPSPRRRR